MNTSQDKPLLLLVDDDDRFRDRLAKAFVLRGYEVQSASSVEEAITKAKTDPPEYAVVDLRLPNESGLDLIRELKQLDAETKIAMLTGVGSISTAVEAMRLGAVHYLQKPTDADQILNAFQSEEVAAAPTTDEEVPSLARAEWEYIQRILTDCGGNISEAARRLKIHRRSLQRKLQKYPPRD